MSDTTTRRVPLADAAALVPCSTRTLRRRIADGSLTAYRFGPKLLLIDLDDLERVFQQVSGVKV